MDQQDLSPEREKEDHATLRRSLIDFGFLRRTSGGSSYWREPEKRK